MTRTGFVTHPNGDGVDSSTQVATAGFNVNTVEEIIQAKTVVKGMAKQSCHKETSEQIRAKVPWDI